MNFCRPATIYIVKRNQRGYFPAVLLSSIPQRSRRNGHPSATAGGFFRLSAVFSGKHNHRRELFFIQKNGGRLIIVLLIEYAVLTNRFWNGYIRSLSIKQHFTSQYARKIRNRNCSLNRLHGWFAISRLKTQHKLIRLQPYPVGYHTIHFQNIDP